MYDRVETPNLPSYAGFWVRVWAACLDAFLYLLVSILGWLVSGWLLGTPGGIWWNIIVGWLAPPLVTIACWYWFGGTPGKLVNSLRIVNAHDQSRPRLVRLILRYLGYFVSGLPFGLGFIWVSVDDQKQGFHDKLSGTIVVREGPSFIGVRRAFAIAVVAVLSLAAWNKFSGRPVDAVGTIRTVARDLSGQATYCLREAARTINRGAVNLWGRSRLVDDMRCFHMKPSHTVPHLHQCL